METENYTLNLNKRQFELLDMIMFEEWRDYVDIGPDDENYNCKYVNDNNDPHHPFMYSVKDFNSLAEVFTVEKFRKGMESQWGN